MGDILSILKEQRVFPPPETFRQAAHVRSLDEDRATYRRSLEDPAFVTVQGGIRPDEALRAELKEHVVKEIGAIARPDEVRFTDALPKTRSGKIMRRLLRDVAAGKETVGDTTTLEDYSVLAKLREEEE